jgi:hypothetical protein
VIDRFKTLLKKANLPAIRFHDIRHGAATILLSMGVHPKVVQELLGHNQSQAVPGPLEACLQTRLFQLTLQVLVALMITR